MTPRAPVWSLLRGDVGRRVALAAGRTLRVGVSGGAAPTCISVQALAGLAKEGTDSPLLSDD